MATDPGEAGSTDRSLDLREQFPEHDFSAQGTVTQPIVTTQIVAQEGPSEPLSPIQAIIMEELRRAGASESTLAQNLNNFGAVPPPPNPAPTSLQPLPPGSGALMPGVAVLPRLDTSPASLGTARPASIGTLAFETDWEDGNYALGKVVFDEIINRQQSGVRLGVLPMIVWQKQTRPV